MAELINLYIGDIFDSMEKNSMKAKFLVIRTFPMVFITKTCMSNILILLVIVMYMKYINAVLH